MLELFFVINDKHNSVRENYRSDRMTTDDDEIRLSRKGRRSAELRGSRSVKNSQVGGGGGGARMLSNNGAAGAGATNQYNY